MERKAQYNAPCVYDDTGVYDYTQNPSYKYTKPPEGIDFDVDFPYGATDFDKKMVLIYVFSELSTISYKLKSVVLNGKNVQIYYYDSLPQSERFGNSSYCTRCFAVTLDKLNIDSAEFLFVA